MFSTRGGLLTPVVASAGTHLTDNFTRADDATTMGVNWTNRNGVMGILSNAATPKTNNTYCLASHNTPMTADDMTVTMTIGTPNGSGGVMMLFLGADTGGTSYALVFLSSGSVQILSCTNWSPLSGFTSRASGGSFATGDVLGFQRVGNVYTVLKNGSSAGVTWTDSGNAVTRSSSNRLVGLGGLTASLNYTPSTNFTADNS